MKIPIIKYSNSFLRLISPFMSIRGITLWPFIILKDQYQHSWYEKQAKPLINHESIHIKQQQELLVIPFYIWYVLEFIIRLFGKGSAYKNISFEREANAHENDLDYLKNRKLYSFLKYMFKSPY